VLDAYPNETINGRVEHIAYESKVISNVTVYQVDVLPDTVPIFFRSGMSATVNFLQSERTDVILLPLRAVKKLSQGSYAFLKTTDPKNPKPVEIKTGLENGDNIEIISGLSEGDEVIIPTAVMVEKFTEQLRGHGGPPSLLPFGGQRR
jgi:macrolide-specific efflux system membrane fusion protein